MGTTDNKRVVEAYMGRFARSDIDGVLAMMSDDATWTVVGKPHLFAGAGVRSKDEMGRVWRELYARLDGGLDMSVTGMVAEGEEVAAEVASHATTKDGRVYANAYHFLITVRAGKVARVKEYTDLMHAAEVFG